MTLHPFFEVLQKSLAGRGGEAGTVLFHVLGLNEQKICVDLGRGSVAEASADDADLVVFCDRAQLEAMLTEGFTARPLRVAGEAALLDRLAEMAQAGDSWLSIRTRDPG